MTDLQTTEVTPSDDSERRRKLLAGSRKGERGVCGCRVRGENKQKKAQVSGLVDSEQRTLDI